ncbi:MAG: PilZ domain-containing protein [Myxococcaceae bacterium]|nr:PilZ domain-containing protein [Myxococcaceae bacterium]
MDPSQWIAAFRVTHEKAKANQLTEEQRKTYLAMREELARSLVAAQSLKVPEGENSRKYFRVAQMFKLEIDRTYQTMTKEISRAGFSAMLPKELKIGQRVGFAITLKRDLDPIGGEAKVVGAQKSGQWRIDFAIDLINEANGELLETALFDAVLARFK